MNIKTLFSAGIILFFSSVFTFAALDMAFTTAISQFPDPADYGVTITFSVSFKANGSAVSNLRVIGGVQANILYDHTFAYIGADMTRTASFTYNRARQGNSVAFFQLDYDETSGDTNVANNRIEKNFFIPDPPGPYPDLTTNVTYDVFNIKEGDKIIFHITVRNIGEAVAPQSKFIVERAGDCFGYAAFDVPPIVAKGVWRSDYEWTVHCTTPLIFYADSMQKIFEKNEVNNRWEKTIKCGIIKSIYSSKKIRPN